METAIRGLWERGRAAWPAIDLEHDVFAAHVTGRLGELAAEAIGRVCAEDLYLACACARGVPSAIAAFEAQYRDAIERAIARIDRRPEIVDELRQTLLVRWLVSDETRPPRIDSYSGRGPLLAWVRIAAGRAALDARRGDRLVGDVDDELADGAVGDARDPEVAYLRARYQPVFTSALSRALAGLTREQRNLLRLHYVEGLTMDALGSMFQTSRASIHRRIVAARDTLFEETCELLQQELGLRDSELESMLRLVRSGIDVGMVKLLETHDESTI